jgi:hypothetical protein
VGARTVDGGPDADPDGTLLLRIAFLDLPLMALFWSYDGALNGRRKFSVRAAVHTTYGIIKLVAILVLIAVGVTAEGAVAAYVISTGIVAAALLVRYRPPGLRPLGAIVRQVIVMAGPIGLYLVAGQVLLSLNLWSLKTLWTGSSDVLGYFVASLNLARVLMIISGAQAGVVFASVAWAEGVAVMAKLGVLGSLYLGVLFWFGELTAADFRLLRMRPAV